MVQWPLYPFWLVRRTVERLITVATLPPTLRVQRIQQYGVVVADSSYLG